MHEVFEQVELECRQLDGNAADLDRLGPGIKADRANRDISGNGTRRASNQRIYSRQQFLHVERFHQVIVSPHGEAFHLVLPVATRRQDQDRVVPALITQLCNHIHAGHLRQSKVDNRQVVLPFLAESRCLGTIFGKIHVVMMSLKNLEQLLPQLFLVFCEQDIL